MTLMSVHIIFFFKINMLFLFSLLVRNHHSFSHLHMPNSNNMVVMEPSKQLS